MSVRLIALEIVGFKSFKERQLIPFHPELTVIIGPNGCGKSNILEALLWGLGESVNSTLRLEKLENILFEGESGNRFFAEVTLFLEGGEGESSSLVVTRRCYSSGENLYFLNKKEVKSFLYQETLREWGLFRSSYVLMAQGKMESLVGKEGVGELRAMMEEIAGLVEFKELRGKTIRNISEAEEDLVELRNTWVETSLRHDQLKVGLENQDKAKELQRELERLEIQVTLLDMYRLYRRIEESEEQASSASFEEEEWNALREEHAVEMQLTLARERLKDANMDLLEAQKESLALERLKELASYQRSSLLLESKAVSEQLDQVNKKLKSLEVKAKNFSYNASSQVTHLNKLLFAQEELEMRRNQLQNQLKKGLSEIIKKVPRGFKRELERIQKESRQINEFLVTNDSLIFSWIDQFLTSHCSFLSLLEQIDWEFLEGSFREAHEDLLVTEVALERQNEKVLYLRVARAAEEEEQKALFQEKKDVGEEESFHKNRFDLIRLRRDALEEKWQLWEETLAKWKKREEKALEEGERLTRLIKNFEETHRHGKRIVGKQKRRESHDIVKWQGEFLALKQLLLRESDWHDFLGEAEESVLESYEEILAAKDLAKERFMSMRVWLSGERMQKDYEEVVIRFEQLVTEREDLEGSLNEVRKILRSLDLEAKKQFTQTLEQFNSHLKVISADMLQKGTVWLEETKGGLSFVVNIKGKGMKTLRALSGGEKTLVFLSFLLAVSRVTEVPFTFLDEIDAVLDEENSVKWVVSLSQLALKRQLILITHNATVARTASQLLGVTLGEKGYTLVYSLDLTKDYTFL